MIADEKLAEHFKDDLGVPAILVFHNEKGLTETNLEKIETINKQIDEASFEGVKETILVYEFSEEVKQTIISENETTFILPVKLFDDLERKEINTTVNDMNDITQKSLNIEYDVTLKLTSTSRIDSNKIDF